MISTKAILLLLIPLAISLVEAGWDGEYVHTEECDLRSKFFEPECLNAEKSEECFVCAHNIVKEASCAKVDEGEKPNCEEILTCIQGLNYDACSSTGTRFS